MTWNKWCCRSPLCTCRLNWARRTSWRWWDEWDDTALQTQNSEFEPWRSEAEHAASRSWRLPTTSNIHEWAGKKHVVSSKLKCQNGIRARDLRLSKQAASTTTPRPLPHSVIAGCISHYIVDWERIQLKSLQDALPRQRGEVGVNAESGVCLMVSMREVSETQQTQNTFITFIQCSTNVEDVGRHTRCRRIFSNTPYGDPQNISAWFCWIMLGSCLWHLLPTHTRIPTRNWDVSMLWQSLPCLYFYYQWAYADPIPSSCENRRNAKLTDVTRRIKS